jgi:hypothetical protein
MSCRRRPNLEPKLVLSQKVNNLVVVLVADNHRQTIVEEKLRLKDRV